MSRSGWGLFSVTPGEAMQLQSLYHGGIGRGFAQFKASLGHSDFPGEATGAGRENGTLQRSMPQGRPVTSRSHRAAAAVVPNGPAKECDLASRTTKR